MKRVLRSRVTYVVLALIAVLALFSALRGSPDRTTLSLSQFDQDLATKGMVVSATIHDSSDEVTGKLADGTSYVVQYPDRLTESLTTKLLASGATVTTSHSKSNPWLTILEDALPFVLLFAGFIVLLNLMQGGSRGVMNFGKAKAKTAGKDQPKVTFADVAGADEAVAELLEIKEFLQAPGRFHSLGAKIPKGVLLFGPPGTGKTLLARAVAGEAGVPFYSISGSDFVEMFVGVGASRVRDLFEQAKTNAPAIVFMDEIDAVGRHRGAGLGGGHDEREQTLNQLLVEMDGFDVHGGVILIAATNRPDILDPALLRPGRFDRQVVVDRPDLAGRRRILEVHAEGKPMAKGADLDVLAKRTPGFTGADLANLLNEAAILTARRNLRQVGMRECEEAIDRVLAGPERKTLVMSDHDKLVTAYHEAGHAIVGHVLPHADPIHKVSIVARSRSLGLTFTLPEDRFNHSRSQLRDSMGMCLGGRTAEELVFEEPTTGAENDIEKVTRIARAMVTEYGMSDTLGPQQLGQRDGEVFLGRDLGHQANYSEEVAAAIDREVRGLIDEAHDRAGAILTQHRATLDRLASELVDKETLDSYELAGILGSLPAWTGVDRSDGGPAPGGQDGPGQGNGRGNGSEAPVAAGAEAAPPPARARRTRSNAPPAPVGATPRSTTTGSGARKSRSAKAKAAAGEPAPGGQPGPPLEVPAAQPIAPAAGRASLPNRAEETPPVRRPRARPKPSEP
jgi:cell division protease FtsH